MTAAVHSGWEGILEPGERILWQGQPDGALRIDWTDRKRVGFGTAATLFGVFWTIGVIRAGAGQGLMAVGMPLFGLVLVLLALNLATGGALPSAWRRRRTWYTLTDRRALIATDLAGRRGLRSFPIGADTVLAFEEGPPAAIWFDRRFVNTGQGSMRGRIGFEALTGDARDLYDLFRRVARGQA